MVSTRLPRALFLLSAALLACATEPDNTPADIEASGSAQFTGTAGAALAQQPAVLVSNAGGKGLGGVTVVFTVSQGGGSVQGGTTTDASGIARVTWTLGTVAGNNVLIATVAGLQQSIAFNATGAAGPPKNIVAVAGATRQSAQVGSPVPIRPSVKVTDAFGNPNAGRQVTFAIGTGGGSVAGASPLTDDAGVATSGDWTLGTKAGLNALLVSVPGAQDVSLSFFADATSAPASQLRASSGGDQSATVGTAVATPPSVQVVDAFDNGVSGVTVTFAVQSGGGSIDGAQRQSDSLGYAAVGSWTLGTTAGGNTLTASVTGLEGSPVAIAATGTPGAVASLALAPDTIRIPLGDTARATPTARDSYGNTVTDAALVWSSTNAVVARVEDGLVTGVDFGTAKIMAAVGPVVDTAVVVVAPLPPIVTTTVTRGVTSSSIWLGSSVIQRGDSTEMWFEWSTSPALDGASATSHTQLGASVIGNYRRISGLLPATTYYYRARAKNVVGEDTGSVESVTTSPAGGKELLKQTGLSGTTNRADFEVPAGATRLEVSSTTSSASELAILYLRFGAAAELTAADCISGYVSTIGEAQLQTCTFDNPQPGRWHVLLTGIVNNATLTALAHGVVSVAVSPTVDTLGVGSTRQFSATVTGNSNTAVTWSSSNTSVAEVSAAGLASAKAVGQTTITARSVADTSKVATATLTVRESHISISLDQTLDTLAVDSTWQLQATVAGASDTSVTWSVVSFSVATVSTTGLVTAAWKGTTTVRAKSNADPTKIAEATVVVTVPKMELGVPLTLSGLENSNRYYELTVPEGAHLVAVRTAGDSGNVDLYLQKGGKPVGLSSTCSAESSTSDEVCESHPTNWITGSVFHGDWYVHVLGKQDYARSGRTDYKNITLTATTDSTSSTAVQVLQNNVSLTSLGDVKAGLKHYKIYVPPNKATLEITATGGTGKIFLLSQTGQMVDHGAGNSGYNCKQEAIDNVIAATCLYNNPAAGWYYISINAFNGYSGYTLVAKYP